MNNNSGDRIALAVIMALLAFLVGRDIVEHNWKIDFSNNRVLFVEGGKR